MAKSRIPAVLVLENGAVFHGRSFGAMKDSLGEVCFNTSMTGYQEILTDPSYKNQIVVLTYPMIGNYGVNPDYNQSTRIQTSGLIVKEYMDRPSNHVSQKNLGDYMTAGDTPGLEGIDTRKLVLMLRNEGAMRGGIFSGREYDPSMLEQVRSIPSMNGQDLAKDVTTKEPYTFGSHTGKRFRIAVIDFGVKTAILKNLDEAGFAVHVLPATTPTEALLSENYDCYFLSNGPGDPEPVSYGIETAKKIREEGKPVFGICLGHQIIGLASGRPTYKLKFGHRGGNQPVKDFNTGRVEITAQNHGFAVMDEGATDVPVTHINLNDKTIEGFKEESRPLISVQYHPEAAPGPNDAKHIFKDFYKIVEDYYAKR